MAEASKPRVLHVHFWADIRYSAGSVEKVIMGFASHGIDFDHHIACCPGGGQVEAAPFAYRGVQVHHFIENRFLNRVMNKMLARGVFTYGSLVRLINRLRPAILHIHNRQELVDALVRRLAYRPKVVVHYHRHFALPTIPRRADLLAFVSAATAAYILGKTDARIASRIVPNPLSFELIEHARHVGNAPRQAPPIILFGGGGNPIKGGREVIDAFLGLPRGSAQLVLAGRGTEKFGLSDAAVDVLGEVSADRFFELMQAASIVVMPSYDEPFGLVAQEAMLMGRLLVTTASGGLAEFVDESSAVIVRPRNVESLREGLARAIALLGRPVALGEVTGKARARMQAFTPDVVVATLEAGYHDLLGERDT